MVQTVRWTFAFGVTLLLSGCVFDTGPTLTAPEELVQSHDAGTDAVTADMEPDVGVGRSEQCDPILVTEANAIDTNIGSRLSPFANGGVISWVERGSPPRARSAQIEYDGTILLFEAAATTLLSLEFLPVFSATSNDDGTQAHYFATHEPGGLKVATCPLEGICTSSTFASNVEPRFSDIQKIDAAQAPGHSVITVAMDRQGPPPDRLGNVFFYDSTQREFLPGASSTNVSGNSTQTLSLALSDSSPQAYVVGVGSDSTVRAFTQTESNLNCSGIESDSIVALGAPARLAGLDEERTRLIEVDCVEDESRTFAQSELPVEHWHASRVESDDTDSLAFAFVDDARDLWLGFDRGQEEPGDVWKLGENYNLIDLDVLANSDATLLAGTTSDEIVIWVLNGTRAKQEVALSTCFEVD